MLLGLTEWWKQHTINKSVERLRSLHTRETDIEAEMSVSVAFYPEHVVMLEMEQEVITREIRALRRKLRYMTRRRSKLRPGCEEWLSFNPVRSQTEWVDDSPSITRMSTLVQPSTPPAVTERNRASCVSALLDQAY